MKKKHIISLTVILSCLTALIAAGGYYIKELYYSQNAEDLAFLSGSYKTELHHLDLRHKLIDRRVPNFCRVLEGTHFIDNIWSIDVAENQLARISDLSCFGNLKELNLSYNAFPRIPDMWALGALETLNMTKNHIREVGNMALRFPKLTTLNLGYNGVVSLNMEFLPKSLSTLELQHNNIMEIRGAKSLENLITLKLEYNNLETADVSDVIKLPKLSSLTLAENHIDDAIVKFWNEKTKKAAGITE